MHPPRPKLRRVCLALAASLALISATFAQTTTGSIEGRVLNATNGSYVNNARIIVEGTNLQAFTESSGRYHLDGVPAGTVKVSAFYTGLPEQVQNVTVTAGGTTSQDFNLGARETTGNEVLKLDPITVQSRREMDAASLAINEQRFAATIKNVVNTDAFGDIAEANIGDFVKFLPGVTIDYVSPDARTVSIRGVPAQYTAILMNGFNVASASSSGESRTVELEQISLKNASRIEITKSRAPEMQAQALGGAVNLIPRSAFEASKPSFEYRLDLSANGDEKKFSKTRGPTGEPSHKIKPGFDFTYELPVNKNFGITLSVMESDIFYPQHRTQPVYGPYNGTQAGATPEAPVLRQYQVQDGPKNNQRESIGFTAGWRIAPRDVLTFDFQWSFYNAFFGNRPVTYTLGNTAPTATNGAVFDPNGALFYGANGAGTVSLGGTSFRHKYGTTYQPDFSWVHTGAIWKADAGVSFSHGTNHYHDYQDAHFENVTATLRGNPSTTAVGNATVHFDDVAKGSYLYPRISVFNNTGATPIDLSNPANYNLTSAGFNPADSVDQFKQARGSIGRDLDLKFPLTLKTGVFLSEEIRDIRKDNPGGLTFIGPDGKANTADDNLSLYDVLDTQYSNQPFLFNTPQVPYPSPYKVWSLYQAHPEYFSAPNPATLIQNTSTASKYLKERIYAAYIQADARPIEGLRIVGGIRFERTDDTGEGPTNDPNAAKAFTDPVAKARAQYGIRTNHIKTHYAAGYPSLDVSYNIRPNLVGRVAYYKAIGRPELSYILPGVTTPDTTSGSGTITVTNSSLKPTQVDGYDASLEYYFTRTGVLSVGAFEKDFSNFQGSIGVPATLELLQSLGVPDPELYTGGQGSYTVNTRFNVGSAKVTGVEFNFKQVLDQDWLPSWARNRFTVFANGQKMHLEGAATADFSNFIGESGSWGIAYAPHNFTVQLNFNYRGRQRLTQQTFTWTPPGSTTAQSITGYEYFKPRVYLDANFEYRFKPYLGLFVNARNLTNVAQDIQRYAPVVTPSWARTYRREEFGVQYTVGIKGKF